MHQPALLHSRVTAGAYSALPSGSCHNLFRSITGVMPPSCHLPCLPATMWVMGPLLTVPLGHTWSGHGGVGLVVLAWDPLPDSPLPQLCLFKSHPLFWMERPLGGCLTTGGFLLGCPFCFCLQPSLATSYPSCHPAPYFYQLT